MVKYITNQIATISTEDLNELTRNLSNIKENYKENDDNTYKEIFFIKARKKIDNVLSYNSTGFIDLSTYKIENISESSKNVLNILAKYGYSYN